MGCACSTDGNEKDAHKVLVGKPEERRPLVRSTRGCENKIFVMSLKVL